jgi:peptide/nickel transport system ATP-binding protein
MYLGKLVEMGSRSEIFAKPQHPYTRALLSAIPIPDPRAAHQRVRLKGELPTAVDLPSGCRFRTRCPLAEARCAEIEPELVETGPDHAVACIVVAPGRQK